MNSFLSEVVLPEFDNNNPFIKARAVWCACQFASHIPDTLVEVLAQSIFFFYVFNYLELILAIDFNQTVAVRLTTAAGIGIFIRDCIHDNIVKLVSTHCLSPLCDLLKYSNEDTLYLILDTLAVVIEKV